MLRPFAALVQSAPTFAVARCRWREGHLLPRTGAGRVHLTTAATQARCWLAAWRTQQPEVSLQHFLGGQNELLYTSQWTRGTFSRALGELVEQQTTYLDTPSCT
jgi:hypothetical protein